MRKNSTPERRVGRAANVTIFLGILFTLIHLLALSGLTAMAQAAMDFPAWLSQSDFSGWGTAYVTAATQPSTSPPAALLLSVCTLRGAL